MPQPAEQPGDQGAHGVASVGQRSGRNSWRGMPNLASTFSARSAGISTTPVHHRLTVARFTPAILANCCGVHPRTLIACEIVMP